MLQQIQQPCNECEGTGEVINPKDRCKTCSGKKVVSDRKTLEVFIDKGMKGGQTINFPGESDQAPDMIPGDVVIVVEEKPHDRFKREGDDLYVEAEVDLLTALGGGAISILHLDDRALLVPIHPGEVIKPGAQKVISGQGMPSYRHHEPGDLFLRLNVTFPETIDPAVIKHLEAALPPRKLPPTHDSNILVEEVDMSDLDARQQQRESRRTQDDDAMDEDAQPHVQCANQ
jgi:DnaJ family protein A protein 2